MTKKEKLDAYFIKERPFKDAVLRLREIITSTALEEDFKWSAPTYTLGGKNVVAIGSFKNHFGVWFFNGALLKDDKKLLYNAQEGKTKALRQLRYTSKNEIDTQILKNYLLEAIENQKQGKEIKSEKNKKKLNIPPEFTKAFKKDLDLKQAFTSLTPGKQREYTDHITSAKQEATRIRRLNKCIPLIKQGKGLHDKYRNC